MITVSVIVTNYNYEAYLGECIESALAQDYPELEVIVIDDGSTDRSAEIIDRYGDDVIAIFQPNGGQASAFNNGFARSTGGVVIFLDADDLLDPTAASTAVELLVDPEVVKVHYPLREIDGGGFRTGRLVPGRGAELPYGDFRAQTRAQGPATMRYPPTTGNAWARSFLERVLPMDEGVFRIGADTLLFELAPFVGTMARITAPQGSYRSHGSNRWRRMPFHDQLDHELRFYRECVRVAERLCASEAGGPIDVSAWPRHGWWPRLDRATRTLDEVLPKGESFALVDDSAWGMTSLGGRHSRPFPTADDGSWLGIPETDAEVGSALDRLLRDELHHIVVGWNARWWLDEYPTLRARLDLPVVTTPDVDVYCLAVSGRVSPRPPRPSALC